MSGNKYRHTSYGCILSIENLQTPSSRSHITPESTFSYSARWQIWCRWYLIALQFLKLSHCRRTHTHEHERASATNQPVFPTQIDSQTEQKVCFSCQLHLWTTVVSKPVCLPPLHLALSSALPRFREVSATEKAPSLLSFSFFLSDRLYKTSPLYLFLVWIS